MMNIGTENIVKLNAEDIVQKHISIIGMTGSGKTMSLYTLAEEIGLSGTKVAIVDPEGEFSNLRFGLKAVVVGRGRIGNHIDIELTPDNAPAAADILCRYDIPLVVLDLSGFNIETRDEFVLAYVGRMWELYQREKDMPPVRLIIDEAQLFAPQRATPVTKKLLLDMGSRARKRNLGLVFATQRPQRIDKDLLDATYIRIFHHVATGAALKAIDDLLPSNIDKAAQVIANLEVGDCLFMINQTAKKVHIRTSVYNADERDQIVGVQMPFADESLAELKRLINTSATADSMKAEVRHEIEENNRIKELEAEIEFLKTENECLRQQQLEIVERNAKMEEVGGEVKQVSGITKQLPPAIAAEVQERDAARSAEAEQRERDRQTRGYKTLLLNVQRQSKLHRQILSYMADHDPIQYDQATLGIAVGLSAATNFSMSDLLKSRLVTRSKSSRAYKYAAAVLKEVEQHYPLIGREQCIADIARIAGLA